MLPKQNSIVLTSYKTLISGSGKATVTQHMIPTTKLDALIITKLQINGTQRINHSTHKQDLAIYDCEDLYTCVITNSLYKALVWPIIIIWQSYLGTPF